MHSVHTERSQVRKPSAVTFLERKRNMGLAIKMPSGMYLFRDRLYTFRGVQLAAHEQGVRCLAIRSYGTDSHIDTIDLF